MMEIETVDDVISAMESDIDSDEYCTSDAYRVTRYWLDLIKQIQHTNNRDRALLRELSYSGESDGIAEFLAERISKYLEENP